ncbi:50S ribosomal protein L28 [bacterium BMS3Abin15]|nr:50S ribosomal protein L28 [bacterium BMS3Abin15]HDH07439.1 50S ribosomal protein L28 [Candidatus Moranbacteria bacterium]HDZ84963.1 50S ribosomal protein L28 [Candidatus Moranbacteria bacterium]
MSRVCDICGRGPQTGFAVSHSKVATKRKFNVNLQTKKIDGKRKKVCTKCIKTMSKVKSA